MTEIAVILGSYQSARHLPDCLESIRRQVPAPAELIVVDAASSDGSADIARGFGATVIESENRGLGFLYNTGARAAAAPYVLVANTDIALEPDCLGALGAALAADDRRFAADPQQLDWSATRVIHARTVGRRGRLLASPIPGFAIDPLVPATSIVPTLSANAGAMLVRRDLLLELGGFDERFFLEYGVDVDEAGAFVPGKTALRVGGALVAFTLVGRLIPTLSKPVTVLACVAVAVVYLVILGITGELGAEDLAVVKGVLARKKA